MHRIGRRACANAVAYSECVWTMPPIAENARYSSRCVGVSDEGRREPSTTSPVSIDTTTICAGVRSPYATPLGLIASTPAPRSTADTLPNVPSTRLVAAKARLASNATSRSSRVVMRRSSP
jgi:hypothetical protein